MLSLDPRTRGNPGLPAGLGIVACLVAVVTTAARAGAAEAAQIQDGFESARTAWSQESTDAAIRPLAHDRTNRAAHEGRLSEHFRFGAGLGSGLYFSYPLPKVPVTDALKASLYVRANRSGVQLFARVVLPGDTDPETKQPSFLLVPGTIYDNADRWQRLEVLDLPNSLERQARVLRATTRRPVRLDGAYVEQLVVNLFTGAGETEAFLDELAIGPVPRAMAVANADGRAREGEGASPAGPAQAGRTTAGAPPAPRVRLEQRSRLKKQGEDGLYHDWIFTAVHAPGADVATLRNVGFDVLIDDFDADPKRFQEAVDRGFLLMPRLGSDGEGGAADPEQVFAAASAFPFRESVLAWDLGDRLGLAADLDARQQDLEAVRRTVTKMRGLPSGVSRLTTGSVADDLRLFASPPTSLDMLGVRPSPWGGMHSFMDTYYFLRQRRDLTVRNNPAALYWATLPATPPREVPRAVWGQDAPPPWGAPAVQAEQVRLMTYEALSAGYRGLAYQGDADLTRPSGRVLLLEMALLNAEIDLCESILANGKDPIPFYHTFDPDPPSLPPPGGNANQRVESKKELAPLGGIRAAAIGTRDRKGVLLLVADYVGEGQYQTAQSARNNMKITVIVPEGAQAFEISPGRRKVLEREQTVGGTRITIEEFDTTALILVTTDVAMADRVEAVIRAIRPRAAQMAIEQAELKYEWVKETNGRLALDGHLLIEEKERNQRLSNGAPVSTDQADLLALAARNIKSANENAQRLDWENAWLEARRASRPLRHLMRGLWENANQALARANTDPRDLANEENINRGRVKRLVPAAIVPPVASPALSAFNTLPQHYLWVDWMKAGKFGRNLVPSGTFDQPEAMKAAGWTNVSYRTKGVKSSVTTEPSRADDRRRLLKLTVEPARKGEIDKGPPFLDHPAAAIRSPAVKVRADQFLRITVSLQRKFQTADGYGGVIVRDSIGGEPLQFVTAEPIPVMKKLVLYRRAPADGEMTVTLGLAGYGEAFFDDLTVTSVEKMPGFESPSVARVTRPRRPAVAPPTASRPAIGDRPSR